MEDGTEESFEFLKKKVDSWSINQNRYKGGLVVTTLTLKEKAEPNPEMDEALTDYDDVKRLWLDALDDMLDDLCNDEPYSRDTLLVGLKAAAEEKK